jgi:hypothetical protein
MQSKVTACEPSSKRFIWIGFWGDRYAQNFAYALILGATFLARPVLADITLNISPTVIPVGGEVDVRVSDDNVALP